MRMDHATPVIALLSSQLRPHGFDLYAATSATAYNRGLGEHAAAFHVPEPRPHALTIVIGNTAALWPRFLAACTTHGLRGTAHPLDGYCRLHISEAARAAGARWGVDFTIRFASDPPPRGVAIQRLAALAGLATISPVGLVVHPVHGPWIALRAALVFDLPGPAPRPAMAPCSRCTARPCLTVLERLHETGAVDDARHMEQVNARWQEWLALRDACPVGRASRYSDRQIRYHYTHDPTMLSP